ncbi:MAG: hypothetical protein KF846_17435 [Cyclobacteriaceae bacterium]|nr:hypothetical protein [Cyclobacteriaceae bacterium]
MRNLVDISLFILTSGLVLLYSCSDDTPSTEADRVKKILVDGGNWQTTSVTIDGISSTELFTGFTIRFQPSNSYTTTGTTPVWARTGSYTFTNDQATSFTREDGVVVEIQSINSSEIILRLTWTKTTLGSGRSSSINGVHIFTFIPG